MRRRIARREHLSEDGFTLVEMLIAVLLTGILISIVLGVLTTFSQVEANNQSTYAELDQLLPVGTSFQHLLRSAVSTEPTTNGGVPTPPFGIYNATHKMATTTAATTPAHPATPPPQTIESTRLTFFTNTGRTSPRTGQLLGPTKVTAYLTCPKITTPTPTKLVAQLKDRACTFKVLTYTAKVNTCPKMQRTTLPTLPCTWTTKGRILFTVGDINNWTTVAAANAKSTPIATRIAKAEIPVFSYYLTDSTTAVVFPRTASPTKNPFYSCTGSTVTKCPADHIQSVKVEVEVATPQALKKGHVSKVEDQTVTYQLSVISQTYTVAVG